MWNKAQHFPFTERRLHVYQAKIYIKYLWMDRINYFYFQENLILIIAPTKVRLQSGACNLYNL